jgi:subtilisin family serine protease
MAAELQDRYVRPRRSIFLVAATSFALAFTTLGIAPASASDVDPATDSWQAAAEAVSATPAELRAEVTDGSLKLVVVRDVNGSPVIETAFLRSRAELDKTLSDLKSDPSVISVEPDSQVKSLAAPPYFSSQWGLTTVAAESVSGSTQGSGIVVAVVDSGVDASHPDLAGLVIDGVDYRDGLSYVNFETGLIDDCVSYTDADYSGTGRTKPIHADYGKYDPNGHGTHVAGIISSNGIGVKSVAPQARIMPVRVLSEQGGGDISDVACGVIYAANNGAHVINMSLGSRTDSSALRAAVAYAVSKDVVVVAASGNNGTTGLPMYPAALPDVIGVGAISNSSGQPVASFSNRGDFVDVVAPGVGIWSTCSAPYFTWTDAEDGAQQSPCKNFDSDSMYESLSGTSMATPFVAGLAALVLSFDQSLRYSDVISIITSSAVDKGSAGYDQIYGFGLINAPAAIQKSQEFSEIIAAQIAVENAAAAESARIAAEQAAAAEAARVAAEQAAAAEAARVAASVPVVRKSLQVKTLKKKRLSVSIAAPAGSTTVIQRKVGKKWKTVTVQHQVGKKWKKVRVAETLPSSTIRVPRAGTYRVQITIPSGKITTKSYRVR